MSRDQFRELRAAAAEHGFRELTDHLNRIQPPPIQPPPRRRWSPLLLVAAVMVLLTPIVYLGASPAAVRIGGQWVRVVQPDPAADCAAANVICEPGGNSRLNVDTTGKVYDCQGHTYPGVKVTASNVTVQHCVLQHCPGWCAWIQASNVVFQDNDLSQVYYDTSVSDDMDVMRFFGNYITIRQNYAHDILDTRENGNEHGAHFDCAQTYDTSSVGPSSHITIASNYCNSPHFHQCLIGEGNLSTDGGGGGGGSSTDWLVRNNYYGCPDGATGAGQAVKLDDIDNVTIDDNYFSGTAGNAIYSTSLSTGVVVTPTNVNAGHYGTFFQQD